MHNVHDSCRKEGFLEELSLIIARGPNRQCCNIFRPRLVQPTVANEMVD